MQTMRCMGLLQPIAIYRRSKKGRGIDTGEVICEGIRCYNAVQSGKIVSAAHYSSDPSSAHEMQRLQKRYKCQSGVPPRHILSMEHSTLANVKATRLQRKTRTYASASPNKPGPT